MNIEEEIIKLIAFINQQMNQMNLSAKEIFMNGNCGNLYTILEKQFSNMTKPYVIKYRGHPYHIVTKVKDNFYDITGKTNLKEYVQYLNTHNPIMLSYENFEIEEILDNKIISKMSNVYKNFTDENFKDEGGVLRQMIKLEESIEEFRKGKNVENNSSSDEREI